MKTVSPGFFDLVATDHYVSAGLYTFTLASGAVLWLTRAPIDLAVGGHLYTSRPPIKQGPITWTTGIEVDSLDLTIFPTDSDLIEGVPFLQALKEGAFDGCEFRLDRVYAEYWGSPVIETVSSLFEGLVGEVNADRSEAQMTINSHTERLNIKLPRELFTVDCRHTLYDSHCGVSKAAYTTAGTVGGAASTVSAVYVPGTGKAAGYFDNGILLIGGSVRRHIKTWNFDYATLSMPLRSVPAPGTSVSLIPACNKNTVDCYTKFGNSPSRFGGCPLIPIPETAI